MIQEISPYVYRNTYHPVFPKEDSYVMIYCDDKMLVKECGNETIDFLHFREGKEVYPDIYDEAIYLFEIDDKKFYLYLGGNGEAFPDCHMVRASYFRNAMPQHLAFAAITSYQLARWYESHRYCGRCGKRLVHDTKERMLYCDACGQMEFPKICPAVIVGVTNGNKLLLSRYAGREYKKYALIAGYTEIGETLEETVKREVMEEVGLTVKNIRYYKSQPWSFTDTILMGFFAELDGEEKITLDEEELSMAQWFERDEIPIPEGNRSLTNEMIIHFKNNEEM